ncbi:sodium- and chloride-dependent glycine transporter 1-like [Haliotis rufescens]|uniref:sodium- and chloride-dependent glycine transporter 1-like n=1 Tax=Haliotis rufescens TaxID=6454 RepID=UPI001EAFD5D9|nr:sodium- and chloride-dependent glycine transporter 1-like [Haliotis rufescens]
MSDSKKAPDRATWGSQVEFILTCVGCAVGLGNVWRFPYLAYKDGGGAFLLPYFLSLFVLGIPLFALDINMGQFASVGPLKVWRLSPIFRGLGIAMVAVTSFIMIYYSVVIAQFVYFLCASMTSELPWSTCLHEWNTCFCRINVNDTSYLNNTNINCTDQIVVPQNATRSPSEEYYNLHVLEVSDGIGSVGRMKWELVLCNLLSWTVCCIITIKGIKSLGKVIYVFTVLPYILLTVMLVRGLTLDGYLDGVKYYITPKPEQLTSASVWGDAAVQIFFSTSTCSGALIAMASYNKFNNNTLRDSILIPLINCLTSFFAGFAIFSVLGFMAHTKGVEVEEVTAQGPGLVFVVYPEALSRMPIPPLWSILFFIMLITLGWSSMISGVESVLTSVIDVFPQLAQGRNNYLFRIGVCLLGFLLGLPQVTQGGSYILNLMDTFVGGFPLLIIGLVELVAVIFVYGIRRFKDDVRMMIGTRMNIVATIVYYYFLLCWCFLSPVLLVTVLVFKSMQYTPITGPGYPEWSEALGWLIVAAILISIPAWYCGYFCFKGGFELWWNLNKPLDEWGPRLDENKHGRYSPGFGSPLATLENVSVGSNKKGGGLINGGYEEGKSRF